MVKKCPFGGCCGNSLLIVSLQRKTPPEYAVLIKSYITENLLCRSDDIGLDVGDIAIEILMQHDACEDQIVYLLTVERLLDHLGLLLGQDVDNARV